jgi:VanZ family protein
VTPRQALLHGLWRWGPLLAYLIAIFQLSSLSYIPGASLAPDFLEHGLEYLGLGILVTRALNDGLRREVARGTLILSFLLCVLYAISDEIHQMYVPNRFADVTDVLSDAAGASLGLGAVYLAQRLRRRGAPV